MEEGMVRVRATQMGYYGTTREIGAEFLIDGTKDRNGKVKAFSKHWMEYVDPPKPGKASEAREPEKPKGRASKDLGL